MDDRLKDINQFGQVHQFVGVEVIFRGTHHDWDCRSYGTPDRSEQAKRWGDTTTICEVGTEF